MDRTKYLQLCQKYAVAREKIMVEYKGIKYYPKEYLMAFDENGNVINIAILKDLDVNSIVRCNLEKVTDVLNENEVAL